MSQFLNSCHLASVFGGILPSLPEAQCCVYGAEGTGWKQSNKHGNAHEYITSSCYSRRKAGRGLAMSWSCQDKQNNILCVTQHLGSAFTSFKPFICTAHFLFLLSSGTCAQLSHHCISPMSSSLSSTRALPAAYPDNNQVVRRLIV